MLAACVGDILGTLNFAHITPRGLTFIIVYRFYSATTVLLASGWKRSFEVAGGVRAERDYPPPDSIATVPHVHMPNANDQDYQLGAKSGDSSPAKLPSDKPVAV